LHFFVAFVVILTQTPFLFLVVPGGQTFRHRFVAGLISSPSLHGFTFKVTFLFFFKGEAGKGEAGEGGGGENEGV